MKRLIVLFLTLTPILVLAQDYQIVRSDFVRFFADSAGYHHGIKIDSVTVAGNDSIFYNYWHVRTYSTSIWSPITMISHTPSFVGRKIIVKPNGVNLLFNASDDTIRINTLAALNESWNLMDMDSGNYIQGTVSQIQSQVILDSLVEMKTIALLLLDSNDNILPHAVNGAAFVISNTLGIVACPDLYHFPNQIRDFIMDGMEKPNRGIFRPECGEPYDDSVGDEYHWYYKYSNSSGYYHKYQSISKIVSVNNSWPIRTLHYQTTRQDFNNDTVASPITISADTVVIDLSQHPLPCSGPMPKESELLWWQAPYSEPVFGINSCNRPYRVEYGDANFLYYPDTTQGPNFYNGGVSGGGSDSNTRISAYGLGVTRRYSYQWYPTTSTTNYMVYYKRGSEECGTPYTFDDLLSTPEIQIERFKLYPNPIAQGDQLNLGGTYDQVDVIGLSGKTLYSKQNINVLETQSLSPGIYLIKTTAETSSVVQRLVITE
ncbi:MAG: hypothetical protein ACI9LA_001193 [Bacteroidia bacterium]|jgi:hypothetical protein